MSFDPFVNRLRHRERSSLAIGLVILVGIAQSAPAQVAGSAQPVLTLRALLDSVRSNHPSVRAAGSRVRAVEGTRTTARAFGNPVIGYQVDQTPFPGGRPLPGLDRE